MIISPTTSVSRVGYLPPGMYIFWKKIIFSLLCAIISPASWLELSIPPPPVCLNVLYIILTYCNNDTYYVILRSQFGVYCNIIVINGSSTSKHIISTNNNHNNDSTCPVRVVCVASTTVIFSMHAYVCVQNNGNNSNVATVRAGWAFILSVLRCIIVSEATRETERGWRITHTLQLLLLLLLFSWLPVACWRRRPLKSLSQVARTGRRRTDIWLCCLLCRQPLHQMTLIDCWFIHSFIHSST